MNQFKLFSVIAMLTSSFISCEKSALDSPSGLQQQIASKAATAAIVTKSVTEIDLSAPGWSEYNACNGDQIDILQGIYHIEETRIITGSRITFQFHTNVSNYKIMDQTTGIAYTGSYVSNYIENLNIIIGQPGEITYTSRTLLTTPGKDNNGVLVVDFHVTVSASGIVSVDFTNMRSECR